MNLIETKRQIEELTKEVDALNEKARRRAEAAPLTPAERALVEAVGADDASHPLDTKYHLRRSLMVEAARATVASWRKEGRS